MSLVIAHMQKNRKYSSITCLMFNSLYTHGINWEWLWVRNYEHTHRPTHRVASGINSVMGLKKTKQEEETRRTQTLFSALSRVPLHTEMRLWEVRECFLVFCRAGQESEQRRGVFQLQKQNRKKLPRSHGGRRPPVDGGGLCGESGPLRQPCSCRLALQFYPKHIKNIDWSNRTSGWWISNLGNPKRCESILFRHVCRDVQLLI